jgi:hypothetical protein
MGKMRHIFLLLCALGLQVAAQNETLTIEAVSSQIGDFLQLSQKGPLAPGNTSPWILSGCTLAVSNRSSCKNLFVDL